MKKVTRNIAIGLSVLWLIFLGKSIFSYVTYKPAPGASGLELLDGPILGMFCVFAAAGAFCSLMLAIIMHKFRNAWYYGMSKTGRASVDAAIACNVLMYIPVFTLSWNGLIALLGLIAWVISAIVCLILLLAAFCEEPEHKNTVN